MQFISNGPQVPEQLLQAHEDGEVAFFCGAGISRPAGLPEFKGLIKKLYCKLNEHPLPMEKAAIDSKQYDRAIGLLVSRRRDSFTKSLDFRKDGISCRRPHERVCVGVPLGGVSLDALDEL